MSHAPNQRRFLGRGQTSRGLLIEEPPVKDGRPGASGLRHHYLVSSELAHRLRHHRIATLVQPELVKCHESDGADDLNRQLI
jgi:hypothetical protein